MAMQAGVLRVLCSCRALPAEGMPPEATLCHRPFQISRPLMPREVCLAVQYLLWNEDLHGTDTCACCLPQGDQNEAFYGFFLHYTDKAGDSVAAPILETHLSGFQADVAELQVQVCLHSLLESSQGSEVGRLRLSPCRIAQQRRVSVATEVPAWHKCFTTLI